MCGWMWLLQKAQSKIKTTNLSLYFGNLEISLLKGIFYLFFWGRTEKTAPERFPKYLLSGLCFLPCEGLIAIHVISLGLSQFAKSAVWRDTVSDVREFGRGSLFLLMFLASVFSGNPDRSEFVGLLKPPGSLMKMQTSMLIQS